MNALHFTPMGTAIAAVTAFLIVLALAWLAFAVWAVRVRKRPPDPPK